MTATVSHRSTCRLCSSKNVQLVVKLEPIPLSENYTTNRADAIKRPRFPVDVYMCADCGHVQQLDVINSKNLWGFLHILFRQRERHAGAFSADGRLHHRQMRAPRGIARR